MCRGVRRLAARAGGRAGRRGDRCADVAAAAGQAVDDIVLLGADPDLIETVSPRLAEFGIFAIIADEPMSRKVNVDIGRVHYNRWVYVGGTGPDIAAPTAMCRSAPRSSRAGGPGSSAQAGRWAACTSSAPSRWPSGPSVIVCTDVSDLRLNDLSDSFAAEAAAKGIEFICLNPTNKEAYAGRAWPLPARQASTTSSCWRRSPAVIAERRTWLAEAA